MENFEWLKDTFGVVAEYIIATISELISYRGVETNSILNTQVMMIMLQIIRRLSNRSEAEKFLTGNINLKPWIAGGLSALGANIPLTSLAIRTATSTFEKVTAYLSAIASMPAYWFGSRVLFSTFAPNLFSERVDDSLSLFQPREQILLIKIKNKLAARVCNKIYDVLSQYQKREDDIFLSFENILDLLQESKSIHSLRNFIAIIAFSHESITNLAKQTAKIITLLKTLGKGVTSISITIAAIALLINNVLTAYYTGNDLLSAKWGKILLGSLTAILTGISSAGFTLFSLKEIFKKIWRGEINISKMINPKAFYFFAIILVVGCLFSAGVGGYAGFTQVQRLLTELGCSELATWLPEVFESLGFAGGAVCNIPYCLGWAQWLLGLYAARCGDPATKKLMSLVNGMREFAETINNTKILYIKSFLQNGNFGDFQFLKDFGISAEDLSELNISEPTNWQLH